MTCLCWTVHTFAGYIHGYDLTFYSGTVLSVAILARRLVNSIIIIIIIFFQWVNSVEFLCH